MTLNVKIEGFEINRHKQRLKFSALNVDFDGRNLDFLGLRKPAHEGIKEPCVCKSRFLPLFGQSFEKTVADRHGHAAYHNKYYSDELFSRINIDDFERL